MSEYRTLQFRFATGEIRAATFEGRDHVVVPVVALVEGVLHAVNAKNPELVLASEFGKFPMGWNGEPVVMNHPQAEDGTMVSANSPEILEKWQIGRIFGTRVDGDKLRMDAYWTLHGSKWSAQRPSGSFRGFKMPNLPKCLLELLSVLRALRAFIKGDLTPEFGGKSSRIILLF